MGSDVLLFQTACFALSGMGESLFCGFLFLFFSFSFENPFKILPRY